MGLGFIVGVSILGVKKQKVMSLWFIAVAVAVAVAAVLVVVLAVVVVVVVSCRRRWCWLVSLLDCVLACLFVVVVCLFVRYSVASMFVLLS